MMERPEDREQWTVEGSTIEMSHQNGQVDVAAQQQALMGGSIVERIRDGSATMNELLLFLQTTDPGETLPGRVYLKLADWLGKVAELLDLPSE